VEILVILLIDYSAAGHALFDTVPLKGSAWLFFVPFGLAMLIGEELRKAVVRSHDVAVPPYLVPMVGRTDKGGQR
jgi:hypothetical protein